MPRWKSWCIILFILWSNIFLHTSGQSSGGIAFLHGNWQQALKAAEKARKLLFVDMYVSWAPQWQWMTDSVFTDSAVGNWLNRHYICYQLDAERGEGPRIAADYQISKFPAQLYLNEKGELVYLNVGGVSAPELLQTAKKVLNPENQFTTLAQRYAAGERGVDFLLAYVEMLELTGKPTQTVAKQCWQAMTHAQRLDSIGWRFIEQFVTDPEDPAIGFLLANKAIYVQHFGAAAVHRKTYGLLFNRLQQLAKQRDGAGFERLLKWANLLETTAQDQLRLRGQLEVNYYMLAEDWPKFEQAARKFMQVSFWDSPDVLNRVAWYFYEKVADRVPLKEALRWSARSVELAPTADHYETYCVLLYANGEIAKAKAAAGKAIELAQKSGEEIPEHAQLLLSIPERKDNNKNE